MLKVGWPSTIFRIKFDPILTYFHFENLSHIKKTKIFKLFN